MRALTKGTGKADRATDSAASPEGDAASAPAVEDTEFAAAAEAETDEAPVSSSVKSLWPLALVVLGTLAWSGFYGWAAAPQIMGLASAPQAAAGLIAEWAAPVLLIGVIWLIAMRHSRAEASRFADSAALLRQESAALEERLTIVNRELSLAREFLAAQSKELEALGRIAAERIGKHAAELQDLIQHNGAEVSAIATTSESALANMNRLRDDLPVVANSARDATNQIGNAGRTASEQLDKLVTGFERLNQFGAASTAQVSALEARVDDTLSAFEEQTQRVETLVSERFGELRAEAENLATAVSAAEETARLQLKDRFATLHHEMLEKLSMAEESDRMIAAAAEERLAAVRAQMAAIEAQMAAGGRRFEEAIEQRQAAFETREAQASEALAQRLCELDEALEQRREAQIAETAKLAEHSAAMAGQMDALADLIARVQQASEGARAELGTGLGALAAQLAAKRTLLAETQGDLAALTDASVRLLEIIQSGARFAREDLAGSIAAASGQIAEVSGSADKVAGLMLQSASDGEKLGDYLVTTRAAIAEAEDALRELDAGFAAQNDDALARLQGLRGGFARLAEESGALAETSQEALRTSLAEIEAAITASLAAMEEASSQKLPVLAQTMGTDAIAALERALRIEAAATIGKLEQSAAHASGIGREAVVQLRDQLAMVNELTGNLEQRVARARELAEEQVNNDFARRMALITDSLNSAAIDITSALSTEVSDTAWEAYLKGDRGIFTRRAVRLIDAATTREIARLYESDEAFRGHVARYIHDFEAMLRSLLSARGGNVLSVTMLGSDMGKLYVTLAQAIQRLRN
jgi:hypothetical protein